MRLWKHMIIGLALAFFFSFALPAQDAINTVAGNGANMDLSTDGVDILKTALILGTIAMAFFFGIIVKFWLARG